MLLMQSHCRQYWDYGDVGSMPSKEWEMDMYRILNGNKNTTQHEKSM